MRPLYLLVFVKLSIGITYGQQKKQNINDLISIPLITTYLPSEYNGGIQNWCIDQDTTGYIYVANNYGLLEFDGANWSNHQIAGGTKTRSVLIDETSNTIFVGGQRELGLFKKAKSGLVYTDLLSKMTGGNKVNEIWDLVAYKNTIYANAGSLILEVRPDTLIPYTQVDDIEFLSNVEGSLLAGAQGTVYFFNPQEGVNKSISIKDNISFRDAVKIGEEIYFFSYENGIYKYKNETLSAITTPVDSFLKNAKINQVLKLTNGNIVIGTQNNGLVILDKGFEPILHLTKNKGLNHRTVISLYEDNFNNLWVGLNNGISVIELNSPFSLINENVGLEGTGYSAITFKNELYLGTSSGLFKPTSHENFAEKTRYKLIEGSEGLVRNISVIDNTLLLSHHKGAFKLKNEQIEQFFGTTGVWGFKETENEKSIGGTYNGFYLISNQNFQELYPLNGFQESSRVFEFANDSILWMTHGYKGAYKLTLSDDSIVKVNHYGIEAGFPSDLLISVYKIDDELLFTGETGIYQYNAQLDAFEEHPFLNKWFDNTHVSKITPVGNNRIYFIAGGKSGVLVKKAIGVYELEEKRFNKINRYISDDLENISQIDNHNILIGAKEGFILYQPHLEHTVNDEFKTYLKKATVTNLENEVSHINAIYFEDSKLNKTTSIQFEFSSPYFDGVSDIEYSYRLHPYEEEWSHWSTTNWKEYTYLPANKYVFEVKALNVYGTESQTSSYSFQIKPRWFESALAYAIYVSITLSVFFIVLYTREKKHRTEKFIINRSKEEEIRSKEREIHEFSEKTNQQIQELKNESLKKEIDHKNSQLASVTMHLLSKNEFVMSLRKKLSEAQTVKDNTEPLNKIVKSIDNNIDKDEAWETFVHHFDQVHGDFFKKIQQEVHLTPQETKLCAYLRMNMSTKDIANLMNITIRGVELGRYRLRKKLDLERDQNLVEYLLRI